MVCDLTNIKTIFKNIDEIRGRSFKETSIRNIYFQIPPIDFGYDDLYSKILGKIQQIMAYNPNIEIEIKNIIIEDVLEIIANVALNVKSEMVKNNPQKIINFGEYLDDKSYKDFLLQEIIDEISYSNRTYLQHRLKNINNFKEHLIKNVDLKFLIFKPFDCFYRQSNYIMKISQEYRKYIINLLYEIQ